jgi:hypothetical protein
MLMYVGLNTALLLSCQDEGQIIMIKMGKRERERAKRRVTQSTEKKDNTLL